MSTHTPSLTVAIRMPPDVAATLKAVAAARGLTRSRLVRLAVAAFLEGGKPS
jgi:predicted transcriptional regulator